MSWIKQCTWIAKSNNRWQRRGATIMMYKGMVSTKGPVQVVRPNKTNVGKQKKRN